MAMLPILIFVVSWYRENCRECVVPGEWEGGRERERGKRERESEGGMGE